MNTETFESKHSLVELIVYSLQENREERTKRLCDQVIGAFAAAWKERFGNIPFQVEIVFDADSNENQVAGVSLKIVSVADIFQRIEGGGWGCLKQPKLLNPLAVVMASQSADPVDMRVLEPCSEDTSGPIDDLVFASMVQDFTASTGVQVAFAEYKPVTSASDEQQ